MSILDSIKGERKLSFNHWRYRILHWAFSVKDPDPKNPERTGLPRFLYTHFCPLFHLTNLIALLSPVILLIKVLAVVFCGIAAGLAAVPWDKLSVLVSWIKLPEIKARVAVARVAPKRSAAVERYMLVELMGDWDQGDFTRFWGCHGGRFETLTIESAEALFAEFMPKILAARERARKRKESLRQTLIFWSNFSRVFIKWALYAFYAALACFVGWLAWITVGPVCDGVSWLFGAVASLFSTAVFLSSLLLIGKLVLWLGILAAVIYGLIRVGFVEACVGYIWAGMVKISPPFMVVGTFFGWVGSCWTGCLEFVAMFYEENCPPITLVTPEEQKVEDIARGEEVAQ